MTSQLPAVPPGPADITHPRRALARLALSSAYRETADFAAGGVPTVSDEYGDAYDYIDHAARLLSMAHDTLARAVVYANERGGRRDDIAEALNLSVEEVRDQYTATIDQWEDALNRPWERSGRLLASRMPDGTTEPEQAAADLDQWCLRQLEENHGARHNARHDGIEDRMVSANLPEHTPVTEMSSLTRTAAYLVERGVEATEAEREAYAARKKRNKVNLCFTPTNASWANPIEAHFGPLRQFTLANSQPPTTQRRPAPCTPTCAGATPTRATPTSSPPNAENVPASAARRASAGEAAP